MSRALSYRAEPGDQCVIFELDYTFERVDQDNSVFYRAPHGAKYGDFMVKGENGHFRRPTVEEMNAIFRDEDIKFASNNKNSEQRRIARETKLQADQVYAKDQKSRYREQITKFYDAYQHEYSRSEDSLDIMVARALQDPKIKSLQPENGWVPSGRTVLDWITDRGVPGKRKARDFMSMTGQMPKPLRTPHPSEVLVYWLLQSLTTGLKPNVSSFCDSYYNDIDNINRGKPLNRPLLEQNEQGRWFVSDKTPDYARPVKPYCPVDASTFWRHHTNNKTPDLFEVAVNQRGKRAKYGGGGFGENPPFGLVCEIDDFQAPAWFLVDDETGIGMGTAVGTLMLEPTTGALIGWDLTGEHASTNSFLRTVRHGNFGKHVPEDLLEICPSLGDIRMRPTWLHTDNAIFAHSHDVEAACADAYISLKYMAKETPTEKSKVEREIGTAQTAFFEMLPARTYDIELMRKFGYDPATQQLIGVREARELFDRYCHGRNLEKRKRLQDRAPAQMFHKGALKDPPNVIEDIEDFDIAMGKSIQDVAVYPTGIDLEFGHYTCHNMGEIAAAFERMLEVPAGDVTPKQERRKSNPKKKLKALGRMKYDPDNIGVGRLWVPEPGNQRWERLECSNPDMHGMPEFIHRQSAALAKAEGRAFITDEQQRVVRGRLYQLMANTSEVSSLKRRKLLGRALANETTAKGLKRYIGVETEDADQFGDKGSNASEAADADAADAAELDRALSLDVIPTCASELAPKHRKDGHVLTPRPSTKSSKPRTYAERARTAARKRGTPVRDSSPAQRTPVLRKAATPQRRKRFNKLTNGDIK